MPPWNPDDAQRHTKKAKSGTAQRQWSAVANSVLERGGSEASAIRQANSVVKRRTLADARHPHKRRKRKKRKD